MSLLRHIPLADRAKVGTNIRQAAFRDRRLAEGLVQVAVFVPAASAADFKLAAERMKADRTLGLDVLRNRRTGRFVSLNARAATTTTIEIVRRFDAYERGDPRSLTATQVGGITKSVVHKELEDLRQHVATIKSEMNAVLAGFDPSQAIVTNSRPMLAILIEQDVGPRRRRALSQRCSSRCRRWLTAAGRGGEVRTSRESNRYIFHVDGIRDWLAAEGDQLIRDHKVAVAGQGVMQFRRPKLVKSEPPVGGAAP